MVYKDIIINESDEYNKKIQKYLTKAYWYVIVITKLKHSSIVAVTKGKTKVEGVQVKCMTFSFGLF